MRTTSWILFGVVAAAAAVAAFVAPFAHNMTFFIALLGLALAFALAGIAFNRGRDAVSNLMCQPMWQMAIGTLIIQLLVAFLLMAFSGKVHWIIAAAVEGLLLCIDAAALTEWKEPQDQNEGTDQPTDGQQ